MAAPFEDEVIRFIAGHRSLKLGFMFVAGIGVFGSAFETLEPFVARVQPLLFRALNVELPRRDHERLSCAYFTGSAQWDLPNANRVAWSQSPKTVSDSLQLYQARLSKCMAALGQSPPHAWSPTSLSADEIARSEAATIAALSTFSGSLQARDRLTYLVHQFANDTSYVLTQLTPRSPDERTQIDSALTDIESERARRMNETLDEAQELCPCKLPRVQIASSSYGALLESARRADEALTRYLQ